MPVAICDEGCVAWRQLGYEGCVAWRQLGQWLSVMRVVSRGDS